MRAFVLSQVAVGFWLLLFAALGWPEPSQVDPAVYALGAGYTLLLGGLS